MGALRNCCASTVQTHKFGCGESRELVDAEAEAVGWPRVVVGMDEPKVLLEDSPASNPFSLIFVVGESKSTHECLERHVVAAHCCVARRDNCKLFISRGREGCRIELGCVISFSEIDVIHM